jgi:signal transduction histidine kinase
MSFGPATWWRRRSLRARVTLGATLVVSIGVAFLAAGVLFGLRHSLLSTLDANVAQRASDVAAMADNGQLGSSIPNVGQEDASAVQVLDASGVPVASSADLEGNERIMPFPLPASLRSGAAATVAALPIGNGGNFRVVARPAVLAGRPVTVIAAVSLAQQEHSITSLGSGLAVGLPILVALVAATTWIFTGYTLRPVGTLAREVDEISATDLHRRVGLPLSRDEVYDLATTLNNTLGRLESASTAQRRFVADAAHELRSPLTAIMTETETMVRAADKESWVQRGPVLLADLRRLHALMDNLLALARLDDPGYRPTHRSVDLDDIVFAELRQVRNTTSRLIDATGVSAAQIVADPSAMARIVRNVLDNAVRHARDRVAITLRAERGTATLSIADDGPGIPVGQREWIFDRFTRLDQARDRETGGSGLGLAIVRELVSAHHGQVWIAEAPTADQARRYPGAWIYVRIPAHAQKKP